MKYKITFNRGESGSFNRQNAINALQGANVFTTDVNKWNEMAQLLDRYDIFDHLQIDQSAYEQREFDLGNGKKVTYGIPLKSNGTPFYTHQPTAAERFLKELRGFGLLSDLVGAGKTFEAGIVLSELAVRGLISSALFIVPDNVRGAWISTMEICFGIGRVNGGNVPSDKTTPAKIKVIKNLRDVELVKEEGSKYRKPKYPLLVTKEDFVKWQASDITSTNVLFDIVIIDEAHHLSNTNSRDSKAMELLSAMMKIKKEANRTYCLLLSATPHNGNLAEMFRLWYFIRCKGGDPGDFDPDAKGNVTNEYENEHKFYLDTVCGGAETIMDFVRREKIGLLCGGDTHICTEFRKHKTELAERGKNYDNSSPEEKAKIIDAFIARQTRGKSYTEKQIENARKYLVEYGEETTSDRRVSAARDKFKKFLKSCGEAEKYDGDLLVDFDYKFESDKDKYISKFFRDKNSEFEGIKEMITSMVAHNYHNRVLRTIMIRQEHGKVQRTTAQKRAVNIMYFPTDNMPKSGEMRIKFSGDKKREIAMKITPEKFDFMNTECGITEIVNGQPDKGPDGKVLTYTLDSYINDLRNRTAAGRLGYSIYYRDFVSSYLSSFGLSDSDSACKANDPKLGIKFPRAGSLSFYTAMISGSEVEDKRASFTLEPVAKGTSDFEYKYKKLSQILDHHKNERIVVFFDYDSTARNDISDATYRKLLADDRYKNRVIKVDGRDKDDILRDYESEVNSAAILVAKERKLTEGTNLQRGRIIVNLQVPTDPLDMQQRIGRVHRIGQESDSVLVYSIANMYELEGYVLAYFNRIGLICDNNGDAEILAGCNNDDMVSIRCKECHKVEMLSRNDYEAKTSGVMGEDGEIQMKAIRCDTPGCEGTMHEIVTGNAVCTNDRCSNPMCRHTMMRSDSEDGSMYTCLYGDGIPCNDAELGNRTYYCSKVCALKHCSRFKSPEMKDKCLVLKEAKGSSISEYKHLCNEVRCPYFSTCKAKGCILSVPAAQSCQNCGESMCKPYSITFDKNKWVAPCPYNDYDGTLQVSESNCFSAYIRNSFELTLDGGKNFCRSFGEEIQKIVDIQSVIRADGGDNGRGGRR